MNLKLFHEVIKLVTFLHDEPRLVTQLAGLRSQETLHALGPHGLAHLLLEVLGEAALGAEVFGNERHGLLGLRVECWVDDQRVDEEPEVLLDLVGLDIDAGLVFLLDGVNDGLDDLVRHVVHVLAPLGGSDAVDEAHLLEAFVGDRDCHLPPGSTLIVDNLQCVAVVIRDVLDVVVHVVLEGLDGQPLT